MRIITAISLSLTLFCSVAVAKDVESLSEETRSLLKSEMNLLVTGFKALFTAYYSGDYEKIVSISREMENSYILKKSLSSGQKEELHAQLPEEFFRLDQRFHYYAGMLSNAARSHKKELVGFYFSELANSCNECHSEFARHRFSAFKSARNLVEDKH